MKIIKNSAIFFGCISTDT